jgi:predicted RNase H-like nuclease
VTTFIGVDLGWYGKPSGLASIEQTEGGLKLKSVDRIEGHSQVIEWVVREAGRDSVVAVDAPLVIPNRTGIREAESELNRDFRRFHAGCHAANLGRPFAEKVVAFASALSGAGFRHGPDMNARATGRFQIEVHPHAASVSLFRLPRIVKYKRGLRAPRARGLGELREMLISGLGELDPPLVGLTLPEVPSSGNLKPAEDRIDAVLCAYIAAYWWFWGRERNRVYGTARGGYIVVPSPSEPTLANTLKSCAGLAHQV